MPIVALALVGLAMWLLRDRLPLDDTSTSAGRGAGAPSGEREPGAPSRPAGRTPSAARYAPRSAAPADAIPGGSLTAHEGLGGAHTLERHVGRTPEELARRAATEAKREVSTFPDRAGADRAVARVLYDRRDRVAAWLASSPTALESFEGRTPEPAGTVYRVATGRTSPGRTVVVVLAPSDRFPEGFRVHTAYVSLP
ncbi:MAG: hypothetical protein IT460_02985 [Planctomycetes bacterium]|nr:hypothetical protein [Planctomycetota bacterium]